MKKASEAAKPAAGAGATTKAATAVAVLPQVSVDDDEGAETPATNAAPVAPAAGAESYDLFG